jgi:hypothetical protein
VKQEWKGRQSAGDSVVIVHEKATIDKIVSRTVGEAEELRFAE